MKFQGWILGICVLFLPNTVRSEDSSLAEKARQILMLFQAVGSAGSEVAKKAVEVEDPAEKQFEPSFRLILHSELRFMRKVCQPTAQQYQTLKSAGEAGMKSAVKQAAATQFKMNQGLVRTGTPEWPEPRKVIADAILRSVQRTLPKEQGRVYEVELKKRAAARQSAVVRLLVAKLDHELVLTAEQRNQLIEKLTANWHWHPTLDSQIEMFQYGDQYLPAVRDELVRPVLTEKQVEVWDVLPKAHSRVSGWLQFGGVQLVDVGDGMADDAELVVPAKADDSK